MNLPNFFVEQVTRLRSWLQEQYWWFDVFFRPAPKKTSAPERKIEPRPDPLKHSVLRLECSTGRVYTRDAYTGSWYEIDYEGLAGRVMLPVDSWITIPDGMRLQRSSSTIRIVDVILSYDSTTQSVTLTGRSEG